MMHFANPAVDGPLLAELREVGVLTPEVMEKIEKILANNPNVKED